MFSGHPHRAPDASFEAVTKQLASWEKRSDGRDTGCFDVHECICAISSWVTREWRSHHVWQLRRLDLKGRICGCVMHVGSAGTSLVEGHSCFFPYRSAFRCLSFRMFFPWWRLLSLACILFSRHCVDSGGRGLIVIVLFQRRGLSVVLFVVQSVCLWSFHTDGQLARAGHPPCKT